MITRNHLAAPVKLLALFVLLAGIPLAALGSLGWRLLEQDRALETQRLRERLDNAASLLARELDRSLTAWDDLLPAAARDNSVAVPTNAVILFFDSRGLSREQGIRLPYYPQLPPEFELPAAVFAAAEAQEFRDQNLPKAAASYRALASSPDRAVRAAALMRLARCLRKQQQLRQALAVYDELATMGETVVAGSPSELVARRERIVLLNTRGDKDAARHEAALLGSALSAGRFRIDRSTFDFYRESAPLPEPSSDRAVGNGIDLAAAVEGVWPLWQAQPAGRAAWTSDAGAFAAVWRRTPAGTAAIVGTIDGVMTSTLSVMQNLQVRLTLEDPAGRRSWSTLTAADVPVTKTFRETGLPWTIHVAVADPTAAHAVSASRRNLFSAGFGLMALVIAAASYFVFLAVNRELGVARLQADFVAAVSHEFRTPLTAMCHLTEILEEGGTPADRLRDYYRALGKESRRLHAMVESLLDFGRMEAGRRTYQFAQTDATELVSEIVEDFRGRASSVAHRLELVEPEDSASDSLWIRADRDALALALRNVLDNALKYSPESSIVRVSVKSHGAFVGICVEDEGAGIPKAEQRDVFRKFARGAAARALNVKGTGIGLTMADQIVKAHGGRLELVSEPGRGSRFTTLLPAQPSHA